jgi:hypothetical protein
LTHERAAALAALRRGGLDAAEASARLGLVECSLESAETRAQTVSAADSARDDEIVRKFLAQHRPQVETPRTKRQRIARKRPVPVRQAALGDSDGSQVSSGG